MSKQRKVYKFRMEPTPEQTQQLLYQAGASRLVWNLALDCCQTFYKQNNKGISQSQLSAELTRFKAVSYTHLKLPTTERV